MHHNRASVVLAALLVLAATSSTAACGRSQGTPQGSLVVTVTFHGGLGVDGEEVSSPVADTQVTVTGSGRTLRLRTNRSGVARTSLRPGRYRVSIPNTGSTSSQPRTAVIRADRTTTARLTSLCIAC